MNPFIPYLTKREQQVLILISYGWSTAQIGSSLFISKHTVDTYRKNLLRKFDVKNCPALIRIAFEKGILTKGKPSSFAPTAQKMAC